jgi:phosphocarrier protein
MPEREATIASRVGLHARPASIFVEAASKLPVTVTIRKGDGKPLNAGSILSLLALGASHGDVVTLAADGDGADDALQQLVTLLETDLDAE